MYYLVISCRQYQETKVDRSSKRESMVDGPSSVLRALTNALRGGKGRRSNV